MLSIDVSIKKAGTAVPAFPYIFGTLLIQRFKIEIL